MLIYLIIITYETYLVQIVYAQKKASIVGFNATAGVIVFFISAWFFSRIFGIYGIAAGIIITQIIVCLLYNYFVSKQLLSSFAKLFVKVSKGFFVALFFAAIGISIKNLIHKDIIMISLVMPAWIIFYFLVARFVMKEEVELISIKEIFKSE